MKRIICFFICILIVSMPFTVKADSELNSSSDNISLNIWNVKSEEIHPEIRFIGNLIRIIVPSMNESFFKLANAFMDNIGLPDLTQDITCEEVFVEREDGTQLRLCVYTPKEKKEDVPGLLWIHGGGYGLGCPEQDFSFIQNFIDATGCVIVAPDYTNSTTAPYPAAFDDCYAALLWLRNNGEKYGMDENRIFVGGNSAGGGLCAAVTLKERDTGDVSIAFQMPLYRMLDDRMTTESMQGHDAPIWNEKSNVNAWKLYLGDDYATDNVSKYAAPARETDYSSLPPTLTYIGTVDPFYDETLIYVENLKNAGVDVRLMTLDGCFHGFDLFSYSTPAKQAREFLVEGFVYATENYTAPQSDK